MNFLLLLGLRRSMRERIPTNFYGIGGSFHRFELLRIQQYADMFDSKWFFLANQTTRKWPFQTPDYHPGTAFAFLDLFYLIVLNAFFISSTNNAQKCLLPWRMFFTDRVAFKTSLKKFTVDCFTYKPNILGENQTFA